eukprot:g6016.t1
MPRATFAKPVPAPMRPPIRQPAPAPAPAALAGARVEAGAPAAGAAGAGKLELLHVHRGAALSVTENPRLQPVAPVGDGDIQLVGELLMHTGFLGVRGLALAGSSSLVAHGWIKLVFRICVVGGTARLRGFRSRADAVRVAAEEGAVFAGEGEKEGRGGRLWRRRRGSRAPKPVVDIDLQAPEHGPRGVGVFPPLEALLEARRAQEQLHVGDRVEARCYLKAKGKPYLSSMGSAGRWRNQSRDDGAGAGASGASSEEAVTGTGLQRRRSSTAQWAEAEAKAQVWLNGQRAAEESEPQAPHEAGELDRIEAGQAEARAEGGGSGSNDSDDRGSRSGSDSGGGGGGGDDSRPKHHRGPSRGLQRWRARGEAARERKRQALAKRQKATKHYPGVIERVSKRPAGSNDVGDVFDVRFEKSTLDGNSVPRGWIRKVHPQHQWRSELSVRVGSPASGRRLRLRAFDVAYAAQWARALCMVAAGQVEHTRALGQLELELRQRRDGGGRGGAQGAPRRAAQPGARRATSIVMMRQRSVYVEEGCGTAPVEVMRVGSCDAAAYVYYDTPHLHANDVFGTCGALFFPSGAQRRVIRFPISDNEAYENGRFYEVALLGCSAGAEVGSSSHAFSIVNVVDDDHYPGPLPLLDFHEDLEHGPEDKGIDWRTPGNVQLCERKGCKFKHCKKSLEHVLSKPGQSVLARPTPGDGRFPAKVLTPAADGHVRLRWDDGLVSVEDRFYQFHHLSKKKLLLDFLRERYRSLWPMPFKSLMFACYSAINGIVQTIIPLLVIDMVILPHLKGSGGAGGGAGAGAGVGAAASGGAASNATAACDTFWGAEHNHPDCPFMWNLLAVLAGLYLFSAVLATFICTYYAEANDGCPETKRDLRAALVSRFVALSEQAHIKIGNSEYLEAATNQVDLVVDQVWSSHYAVVVQLLELALQIVAGVAISANAIGLLLVANSLVIGVIFSLSLAQFQRCEELEAETETTWLETLRDLAENAKLYHSYAQFSAARIKEAEFACEIEENMQASIASWDFMRQRTNALAMVNQAMVAGLLVVGARLCADGDAEIGELVAMLSIYARCATIINSLFECTVKLVRGSSALQRVCQILNMPVAHDPRNMQRGHAEDKFAWAAMGYTSAMRAKALLKGLVRDTKGRGQARWPGQATVHANGGISTSSTATIENDAFKASSGAGARSKQEASGEFEITFQGGSAANGEGALGISTTAYRSGVTFNRNDPDDIAKG